jgi:hypothetical protein
MRTFPLLVVQTWFVPPDRYELELASNHDASTRIRFQTRDRALYQDALQVEGHDIRIRVDWHWAGAVRMVDAIDPVQPDDK